MQYVYVIGSKGFRNYGGYETFVDKLTECHMNNKDIRYYIACKNVHTAYKCIITKNEGARGQDGQTDTFSYHNAVGFKINVPAIGPAQAIYYDVKAFWWCIRHIRENHIERPIIYILACRIGPFAWKFGQEIHKLGGRLYVNPDGHEWMRGKWPFWVRKYWKLSERLMVKHCDLLICDSKNIERYIRSEYKRYQPQTTFIAYGADPAPSTLADDDARYVAWLREKGLRPHGYYLIVGRFVPENNFEIMIREFMESKTKRDLAIITTADDKFSRKLEKRLHFQNDPRIKFVGAVYEQELLKKIREDAWAYIHGHEVGGTNPSLLEALGSTEVNLLLDVGFNKEVGQEGALYWGPGDGELKALIERTEGMSREEIRTLGERAKKRIAESYTWEEIERQYRMVFLHVIIDKWT